MQDSQSKQSNQSDWMDGFQRRQARYMRRLIERYQGENGAGPRISEQRKDFLAKNPVDGESDSEGRRRFREFRRSGQDEAAFTKNSFVTRGEFKGLFDTNFPPIIRGLNSVPGDASANILVALLDPDGNIAYWGQIDIPPPGSFQCSLSGSSPASGTKLRVSSGLYRYGSGGWQTVDAAEIEADAGWCIREINYSSGELSDARIEESLPAATDEVEIIVHCRIYVSSGTLMLTQHHYGDIIEPIR